MSYESRVKIGDIRNHIGERVQVCGFVKTIRDQKRRQFVILSDRSGRIQIFHEKVAEDDALASVITSLTEESAVSVIGQVVENEAVRLGGIEIVAESVTVESLAASPLPLQPDSLRELQLEWRQLSLRSSRNELIFSVQTTLEAAMRRFWLSNGFLEIHSPKIMGSASESGAELFAVPYFGGTAYLAQSPQFYKQMAMAAGFERVFEIGPVFRANPSFTSRHDTEFTSIDVEVSWIDSHEDVMSWEERLLRDAISEVQAVHGHSIGTEFGTGVTAPSIPFPRITLGKAKEILAARGHFIGAEEDLDPMGERLLSQFIRDEYGHEFVFVTDYPATVRAFYHMRYEEAPSITKSFDLLWKGLEVTTGAQREHRIDRLERQALEKGLSLEPLSHYLNFFRYGCPPHGGFGLGLTRLLMILFGADNVRDVTFLYRGPNRITP